MVFAVSVKHSQHIAQEFCNAGYKFVSISGDTDDAVRYKAFQDLKSHAIDGIVNVDIAGEGVSVDGVEVVIMIRPISELAFGLYAQQIGRALRLFPGKDRGIIIDMVGNAKRHGFVEDKTDWTLWEGEEKKKRGNSEAVTPVKTCPSCFLTHKPKPLCPKCGYVYPTDGGRDYEQVDGELVELERKQEIDQRRTDQNAMMREAKTPAGLAAIDAQLGLARGATAHKQRAIEEKKKAVATLNKALRHWKEQCMWGDVWKHEEVFPILFGCTEKEAKSYGATRMNRVIEKMRRVYAWCAAQGREYALYDVDWDAVRREVIDNENSK